MGAGAGNAATELIVATLDKLGYEHEWDVFGLLDAAEFVVAPIHAFPTHSLTAIRLRLDMRVCTPPSCCMQNDLASNTTLIRLKFWWNWAAAKPWLGRKIGSWMSRWNWPNKKKDANRMTVSNTKIKTGAYESYVNISGEDQKEAILFLHGSGPGVTAWSNWQFALPALDGQFHCIAPDLAGFGATDHPNPSPSGMHSWMRLVGGSMHGIVG